MRKENRNNILVINSLGGGGAERQFSILLDYLPIDKIICLENENAYLDETKHSITYLTSHNSQTSSLYKYLYTPIYALKLYRVLKHVENPRILSVLERSHLSVYLLSFILKLKYIMCFQVSHNSHYIGITGQILKNIFKLCASKSSYCISNSIVGALEIEKYYQVPSERVMGIPNGYDFNEIFSRANQIDDCPYPEILKQQYILCVARFFEQKAQDKLINCFKEVISKHPNTKLVFAGIGNKLDECIELSKSLGFKTFVYEKSEFNLDYEVYFLGFQRNPLVLMKHARIFAFPTFYEGLPNALIEAMISGTSVVASDCPTGPREIIAPDSDLHSVTSSFEFSSYGALVKPFSNEENDSSVKYWVEVILKLLEDDQLTQNILVESRKRVIGYEIPNIAAKWNELLNSQI